MLSPTASQSERIASASDCSSRRRIRSLFIAPPTSINLAMPVQKVGMGSEYDRLTLILCFISSHPYSRLQRKRKIPRCKIHIPILHCMPLVCQQCSILVQCVRFQIIISPADRPRPAHDQKCPPARRPADTAVPQYQARPERQAARREYNRGRRQSSPAHPSPIRA